MFNQVLLGFLLRHPQILSNPVMLVGESYGGMRATLMLNHLFKYASLSDPSMAYQDAQLASQEATFFAAAFGTSTPTDQQIASKFNGQILIEPALIGGWQVAGPSDGTPDAFNRAASCKSDIMTTDGMGNAIAVPCWTSDPLATPPIVPTCDSYNCDKGPTFSDDLEFTAAANLTRINVLTQILGANVKNIEWMYGRNRSGAYGRLSGDIVATPELYSTFGALGPNDRYFLLSTDAASGQFTPGPGGTPASGWFSDERGKDSAAFFLNRLTHGVSTFITVARYGGNVVWTPDIRYAFEAVRLANLATFGVVKATSYDKNEDNPLLYPPGTIRARHGRMKFDIGPLTPLDAPPTSSVYATTPGPYESGHSVTERAPAELLADVMDWYAKSHP